MNSFFRKEISRFFCRHLVGLSVAYRSKASYESKLLPRVTVYSGTLIKVQKLVCFLTAGHVLRELEKLRACDQAEIASVALIDTCTSNRVSEIPIPFDINSALLLYQDDDELGLDFGIIPLSPYYVRLLAKNGVVAIHEKDWIDQGNIEFDGYALLGFPQELISERVSNNGECTIAPVMFPVQRLPAAPDERPPTQHPQFIGQLTPSLRLNSVKGMSGGPIFGFRNADGQYWIVALQSSWNPQKHIIYGCSLPVLGTWLTKWANAPASAA